MRGTRLHLLLRWLLLRLLWQGHLMVLVNMVLVVMVVQLRLWGIRSEVVVGRRPTSGRGKLSNRLLAPTATEMAVVEAASSRVRLLLLLLQWWRVHLVMVVVLHVVWLCCWGVILHARVRWGLRVTLGRRVVRLLLQLRSVHTTLLWLLVRVPWLLLLRGVRCMLRRHVGHWWRSAKAVLRRLRVRSARLG